MIKNFLLLSIIFLVSISINAHQPDLSSTMLIEKEDGSYILQIRAALTAFEYEVHTKYGENSYTNPDEFKDLVLKHLAKNIFISCDESVDVFFQNPSVKLGHETTVVLELMGVPSEFKIIKVKNSGFSDIHRNQSALIIYKNGFKKDQFILNNKNKHTVELICANDEFILKEKTIKTANYSAILGTILGVLFFLILITIFKYVAFKKDLK